LDKEILIESAYFILLARGVDVVKGWMLAASGSMSPPTRSLQRCPACLCRLLDMPQRADSSGRDPGGALGTHRSVSKRWQRFKAGF
jgi:hypothetical protein